MVLRAERAGTLTIANAGHLAPYLNGEELACESGLPLGLSAIETYAESTHRIDPGQQLTLITDGVLEARKATTGELYGFERTAAISMDAAEGIAQAAQAFGQDDDFTVLTVRIAGL